MCVYIYIYICICTYIISACSSLIFGGRGLAAIFVLTIPGSRFRGKQFNLVFETSRDHLLLYDLSRLSMKTSGIVSRKTAVET